MSRASRPSPTPAAALKLSMAGLAGFVTIWILIARGGDVAPTGLDVSWADRIRGARDGMGTGIARAFDVIGGPIVSGFLVPATIVAVLLVRRRPWAAVYLIVASSASALTVRIIKHVVARPRPDDILVTADFGSFPSGHSANAAATVTIIALLLPRRRWIPPLGALYVVLMMVSRTYLSAHWVTDTVAGALIGSSVALLLWATAARRITIEQMTRTRTDDPSDAGHRTADTG